MVGGWWLGRVETDSETDDYRVSVPDFCPVIPDFCAAVPDFYPAIPDFCPVIPAKAGIQRVADNIIAARPPNLQ